MQPVRFQSQFPAKRKEKNQFKYRGLLLLFRTYRQVAALGNSQRRQMQETGCCGCLSFASEIAAKSAKNGYVRA